MLIAYPHVYDLANQIRIGYLGTQADLHTITSRLVFNHNLTRQNRSALRLITGRQIVYIAILKLPQALWDLLRNHAGLPPTYFGQYGDENGERVFFIRLSGSKIGRAAGWTDFFNKMTNLKSHIGFCAISYLAIEHDMEDRSVEGAMHFVMMVYKITGEWYNLDPSRVRAILNRVIVADNTCRFAFGETDGPDSPGAHFMIPLDSHDIGHVYLLKDKFDQAVRNVLRSIMADASLPQDVRTAVQRMLDDVKIGSTGPDDQGHLTRDSLWARIKLHLWAKCYVDSFDVVASPSRHCSDDETRLQGRYFPFEPTTAAPGGRIYLSDRPANTRHISREHFSLTRQEIEEGRDSTWSRFVSGQVGPPYIGNVGDNETINETRHRAAATAPTFTRGDLWTWYGNGLVTLDDMGRNVQAGFIL